MSVIGDLGYLSIDNRAAGGTHFEAKTFTCKHCQAIVVINPKRTRDRYRCRGCDHLLCDGCGAAAYATGICKTFQQIADEYLEAASRGQDTSSLIILP